jgi:hypothetical protein
MLNVASVVWDKFNYRAFSADLKSTQYGITDVIKRA